jgi:hypothetical protein
MINKLFNTRPIFAHGCGRRPYLPLWDKMVSTYYANPGSSTATLANITLLTVRNEAEKGHEGKNLDTFDKSCRRWGIIPRVITVPGPWKNTLKAPILAERLQEITDPYVLVADSADVFLVNNPEGLVGRFLELNCKMLFNAEKNPWPQDLDKGIVAFEESVSNKHFPYLNAGLWIAETTYAQDILTNISNKMSSSATFEQGYYKEVYFKNYPAIRIDDSCVIFQNINRVDQSICDIPGSDS